jgi:hypothetical protein
MKVTPKTITGIVGAKVGVKPRFSPQTFFKQLAYYEQCNFLITASIESKGDITRQDGLAEDHAYAVLKLQKAHGMCMIKLRNPLGVDEWHGRFSRNCQAWHDHPQLARDLCSYLGQQATGEFWMLWEDFTAIFTDIEVCPACLPVPKQPPQQHLQGQQAMPRCGKCHEAGDRWWCMSDVDEGDEGEWVRLKPGDFCLRCRRAHWQEFSFSYDIAGIDALFAHPRPRQPVPPRQKPLCNSGTNCCEHEAEHFAMFSHPWLTHGSHASSMRL